MEPRISAQRNMGLRRRQVSHRSYLVVLSFLAASLSAVDLWAQPGFEPAAAGDCLQRFDGGQHRGWMDLFDAAEGGQKPECFAQDSDAHLRVVCYPGLRRA